MSTDGQGTKFRRNIAENFNHLSTAHKRYRRQTDRQTDGRQQIANVNGRTDGIAVASTALASIAAHCKKSQRRQININTS